MDGFFLYLMRSESNKKAHRKNPAGLRIRQRGSVFKILDIFCFVDNDAAFRIGIRMVF